jgi:hypothetical protein
LKKLKAKYVKEERFDDAKRVKGEMAEIEANVKLNLFLLASLIN